MKKLLMGLLILTSLSSFAGTAVVRVVGWHQGHLKVSGTLRVSNIAACQKGTLVPATEDVEDYIEDLQLEKDDQVHISASQVSSECVFLLRKINKMGGRF